MSETDNLQGAQQKAVKMLESNGLTKMSSWVGEGPMTFRVAGLVGGLVMFLQSLFGFFDQFLSLKPLAATLSVYTLFMGFVIVMLEGQCFPQSIKKVIRSQAKFLTLVNGRGIFYIFVGTLNMAQNDFARTCVGLYMAVIGVVMFGVGVHSKGKLDHVRALLKDESVVRAAFNTVDIEGDNALTAEELGMLCTNLGSTLEPNELETALHSLDKNGDGKVSYDEFIAWWKGDNSSGFVY
eukprot:CAMPEP_0172615824 /NCGR_PEP_ID=MMETSP1068-20121228/62526_1 /TAXON_ID=35684 /ORGANISM="Pseudopedinella elastica, Strain CCMP716" /LENGTH=237 /DNA_ID=CAMNT_0013421085 /DNA_START=82 /DNA_END=795 /DNA_ORIENTATION=-